MALVEEGYSLYGLVLEETDTVVDWIPATAPRVLGDIPELSGEESGDFLYLYETGGNPAGSGASFAYSEREEGETGARTTGTSTGTGGSSGANDKNTGETEEKSDTADSFGEESEESDTGETTADTGVESKEDGADTADTGDGSEEDGVDTADTGDGSEEDGADTAQESGDESEEDDAQTEEDTDDMGTDENESETGVIQNLFGGLPVKFIAGGAIAAAVIVVVAVLFGRRALASRRDTQTSSRTSTGTSGEGESAASCSEIVRSAPMITEKEGPAAERVGKLHNIGKRSGQQDSLGIADTPAGVLAVVADGMGGLADGDKVSQKVVMTMLAQADSLTAVHSPDVLKKMVDGANTAVNRMLGPDKLYKCGSTLLAVLAGNSSFEWVTVGDSRIYLYRNGRLIQLNREHVYEAELMQKVVRGELTFAEARSHPKRKGLTSFIGMGKLKYVDGSCRPIPTEKGDILLLMSDGVFNTLSEKEMCAILAAHSNPADAADVMEQQILLYNKRTQDNFTAIILPL